VRFSIVTTILAGLIILGGCSDPSTNKSKAVTGEAAPVASQPATGQGQKYVITPQNSQITFVASKVTGSHNGSFGDFSGQIDYHGTPEQSRVNINIKSDSITTDTPDLTKHLKTFSTSPNFPKRPLFRQRSKPAERAVLHIR
jgi:PBP1b-binding outer membrane lipoprotein LpoB